MSEPLLRNISCEPRQLAKAVVLVSALPCFDSASLERAPCLPLSSRGPRGF